MPIDSRYYEVLTRLCAFAKEIDPALAEDADTVARALGPELRESPDLILPDLHLTPPDVANHLNHVLMRPELEALARLSAAIDNNRLGLFFIRKGFFAAHLSYTESPHRTTISPLQISEIEGLLTAIQIFYGVEPLADQTLVAGAATLTGEDYEAAEAERKRLADLWLDCVKLAQEFPGVMRGHEYDPSPKTPQALLGALAKVYGESDFAQSMNQFLNDLSKSDAVHHYVRSDFDLAGHVEQLAAMEQELWSRADIANVAIANIFQEPPLHENVIRRVAQLLHDVSVSIHDDTSDLERLRDANAVLEAELSGKHPELRFHMLSALLKAPLMAFIRGEDEHIEKLVQEGLKLASLIGVVGTREANRSYHLFLTRQAAILELGLAPNAPIATVEALTELSSTDLKGISHEALGHHAFVLFTLEQQLRDSPELKSLSLDVSTIADILLQVSKTHWQNPPSRSHGAISKAIMTHGALRPIGTSARSQLAGEIAGSTSVLFAGVEGPTPKRSVADPHWKEQAALFQRAMVKAFPGKTVKDLTDTELMSFKTFHRAVKQRFEDTGLPELAKAWHTARPENIFVTQASTVPAYWEWLFGAERILQSHLGPQQWEAHATLLGRLELAFTPSLPHHDVFQFMSDLREEVRGMQPSPANYGLPPQAIQELQDLANRYSPLAFLDQLGIKRADLNDAPLRALRTLNGRLDKRTVPGSLTALRATLLLAEDILKQERPPSIDKEDAEQNIRATIMNYLLSGNDAESVIVLYPRHLPILLQDLAKKHEIPINHVFAQHYYRAQLSDVRRVVIGTRVMLEKGDLAFRQRLETQVPPVNRVQAIETVDQLQNAVQKTVSAAGFPYTGAALASLPESSLMTQDLYEVIALMARYEAALPPPTDRAPHDARLFQQIAHAFLGPKGLVSTESGRWQDKPQLIIDTITHCATAAQLEASAREALVAATTRAAHDFARTHREEERARRDTAQRKRAK